MSLVRIGYYEAFYNLIHSIRTFHLDSDELNLILNALLKNQDSDQYSLEESVKRLGEDSRQFKRFITAKDTYGNTALNKCAYLCQRTGKDAAKKNCFAEIMKILLSYGADKTIVNTNGFSLDDNGLSRTVGFFQCKERPVGLAPSAAPLLSMAR